MLTGFVDLGEINNRLAQFEQSLNDADESEHDSTTVLAKSMVVMMVKGLFSSLTFAYAQFPCASLTGEQLFNPFWEAVLRLERLEFKVKIIL